MIVIDSSALVDAMLLGERGLMVRERLQADDVWFAPEIIDVEVAHVDGPARGNGPAAYYRGPGAAGRYEDFSEFGSKFTGKLATRFALDALRPLDCV